MTNKYKKFTVTTLIVIFAGLLTYNLTHPYIVKSSNSEASTSLASSYDDSEYSNYTSASSEEPLVEEQPTEEEIWQEKYRDNHLETGAQPYKSLYGKNKKSGLSEIRVTAPVDNDALVMIKNSNDKVIRHAYIRSNEKYSFHVPAGYYQVYFICGYDWCPEKEAPNGQKGYFLFSSTSKDNQFYLDDYQYLEYKLQSMVNGNFRPEGASPDEAF